MHLFADKAAKAETWPRPSAAALQRARMDGGARSDHDFGRMAVTSRDKQSAYDPSGRFKTLGTAGGLTGVHLDVSFSVSDTKATGLQAIQTVMATGGPVDIGTMVWKHGAQKWSACVDGGKNSPFVTLSGNAPAHPTKPYYLTATEAAAQTSFAGTSGNIRITDTPSAAAFDEVHFETAIVAIDGAGAGKDKIVKAFKWGWTGKGAKPDVKKGTEIAGKDSGLMVIGSVTPEFKNIVKHDYPGYVYI